MVLYLSEARQKNETPTEAQEKEGVSFMKAAFDVIDDVIYEILD